MNYTLLIPGLVIGFLLLIMLNRRFKLLKIPQIKPIKCHIDVKKTDKFIQEAALIGFFCLVFVGIRGFDWRIACIVCGIAGILFCFPHERGDGK